MTAYTHVPFDIVLYVKTKNACGN